MRRLILVVVVALCNGCIYIRFQRLSDPACNCVPVKRGASREEVRRAIGFPAYTEMVRDCCGFGASHMQDVYETGADWNTFYIDPFLAGPAWEGGSGVHGPIGVMRTPEFYHVLVKYDGREKVVGCEVVLSWMHGRNPQLCAMNSN